MKTNMTDAELNETIEELEAFCNKTIEASGYNMKPKALHKAIKAQFGEKLDLWEVTTMSGDGYDTRIRFTCGGDYLYWEHHYYWC